MSAAVSALRGSMRISSGPLRIMLKPRSAFSSWRDETPRSRSAPPICRNAQLIENLVGVAEICLAQGDAPADVRELFARVLDRVRILIERQHVRAGLQNRFGVSAAAAGSIDNERARSWREQFDRLPARAPDDDK